MARSCSRRTRVMPKRSRATRLIISTAFGVNASCSALSTAFYRLADAALWRIDALGAASLPPNIPARAARSLAVCLTSVRQQKQRCGRRRECHARRQHTDGDFAHRVQSALRRARNHVLAHVLLPRTLDRRHLLRCRRADHLDLLLLMHPGHRLNRFLGPHGGPGPESSSNTGGEKQTPTHGPTLPQVESGREPDVARPPGRR